MDNSESITVKPAETAAPEALAEGGKATSGVSRFLVAPSRMETLSEVFWRMFVIENSRLGSAATFLLGLASFGWVVDSTLPVVQELGHRLLARWLGLHITPTDLSALLLKLATPAALFILVLCFLYWNARRNTRPIEYGSVAPNPHKGLIMMLSKYSKRYGKEGYDSPETIVSAIEAKTLDLDKLFDGCNWGQMAFVVRYHAPMLERCWVVVTKGGSAGHFEHAEKLIKHLAERNVECRRIEVSDENDIGETAQAISNLYCELSKHGEPISASDVIADFTGSTAAMSGGMIIATLNERENVEYVNQRASLNQSITAQQVRDEKIIISPRTSLRLVQLFARRG